MADKQATPKATSKGSFDTSNIPGKVSIRFTGPEDVDRVMDYYLSNPHEAYAPRDNTPEQIRDGKAVIVEDEAGTIWAASVAYESYDIDPDTHEEFHRWSEIGTTRITLNGCGLYPILIAAQALLVDFEEPPADYVYADIHTTMDGVIALLHGKLQWPLFDAPPELHEKCQASLAEDKRGIPVNYYQCGEGQMPHQSRTVLKMIDDGGVGHKSGQFIEFDTSAFPHANQYLDKMRELAAIDTKAITVIVDVANDDTPQGSQSGASDQMRPAAS